MSQNISSELNVKDFLSVQNINIHPKIDQFCIRETDNYFNPYLIIMFANDQITKYEKGVHFQCVSPKLFIISYDYTFSHLKEKVCTTLGLPYNTILKNLYYQLAQLINQGLIM